MIFVRALLTGLLSAVLVAGCEMPSAPEQWSTIDLAAKPVAFAPGRPDITTAGPLTFRGGLQLTSTATRFGGLSGLYVDPSGSILAVSDAGTWFSGDLKLDEQGNLVGLENARIASMRDETGMALKTKRDGDAEDVAALLDGRIAVSFEQNHRILIYDILLQGPAAPAKRGPPLGERDQMGANEGLEAMTTLADGRLIGIAEYAPRDVGAPFWILDPGAQRETPSAGKTDIPPGYGVVAIGRLPNGDLLRLERFYLPLIGVRMQFRILPAAAVTTAGSRLEGAVVATLEPPIALDNFEAISIVPKPDGSARIYMLSDDNFSSNQKTLLYALDYAPPSGGAVAAAPSPPEPEASVAEAPPPPPEFTPGPAPTPSAAPPASAQPAAAQPAAAQPAAAQAQPRPAQPRPTPPRREPARAQPQPATPVEPPPRQPAGPQP